MIGLKTTTAIYIEMSHKGQMVQWNPKASAFRNIYSTKTFGIVPLTSRVVFHRSSVLHKKIITFHVNFTL